MGLLARLHETRGTWRGPYSLKDPALAELFSDGGRTLAGPVVNEFTAFTCAAFWNGVDQISSDVAKLPLNLKKRRQGGGSEDYTDSKLFKLLKYSPNPEVTSMVFRKTITAHALTYRHGGFAEIVRDGIGRPVALWLLHPKRVEPFYADAPGDRKVLRYRIDGQIELEPRDVLHIRGLTDDTVSGFGMVNIAREALGLALASQQFAGAFFGNGTRFGGVLSTDGDVDEEQEVQIRERIEKIHARADKAFRLLVLGMGFKYTESGVKPNDAQMTEIRDQQVTEIARYLNIPLHKLKLNTPGAVSYASVEMADLDYYKGCLLNWIVAWEEELNAKLIPSLEIGIQYFKHNANAFLRGDFKTRQDGLATMYTNGIINADEWLDLEDMNPQPDGLGKMYIVQSGFVPKDKLQAIADAQIAKNTQPPQGPEPPDEPPNDGTRTIDITILIQRLERAEQVSTELREQYQQEREARIAAEAKTGATVAELAERRASEASALARATNAEIVAEGLRKDVERETAARQAADEARVAAEAVSAESTARADAACHAAEDAQRDAADARETCDRLMVERDAAVLASQDSDTRAAEAERLRSELSAELATATTERDDVRAALETMTEVAERARAKAEALQTERDGAGEEAARAKADAAEAERLRAEFAAQLAERDEQQAARQEALAAATREADEARSRADAADAERQRLEAALATATATVTAREAEACDIQAREVARLTATLGAHRALVVDVVQRLVAREADRARKDSPEKLRGWLQTFYVTFEDQFLEAILPAVRVHLAWKRSDEDPRTLAATIAQQHVTDSRRDLEGLLSAEPGEFAVALDHLLTRWEADRPAELADALLEDEALALRALGGETIPVPARTKRARPKRRVVKSVTRDADGRISGAVVEEE